MGLFGRGLLFIQLLISIFSFKAQAWERSELYLFADRMAYLAEESSYQQGQRRGLRKISASYSPGQPAPTESTEFLDHSAPKVAVAALSAVTKQIAKPLDLLNTCESDVECLTSPLSSKTMGDGTLCARYAESQASMMSFFKLPREKRDTCVSESSALKKELKNGMKKMRQFYGEQPSEIKCRDGAVDSFVMRGPAGYPVGVAKVTKRDGRNNPLRVEIERKDSMSQENTKFEFNKDGQITRVTYQPAKRALAFMKGMDLRTQILTGDQYTKLGDQPPQIKVPARSPMDRARNREARDSAHFIKETRKIAGYLNYYEHDFKQKCDQRAGQDGEVPLAQSKVDQ